jgi:hypothetical protein
VTGRREREVSSYWMILSKQEASGNLKRKHKFAFCGELALAEFVDLA